MKIFIAILFAFIFSASASFESISGNFAYVFRFNQGEPGCIVMFDADKDEIIRKIDLPPDSGFNNLIVDESGGCYIACFRKSWRYGRDIYYYDPKKNNIEHFIDLGDIYGPQFMAMTKDELIVQVSGHAGEEKSRGGVVFIDRKTKKINGKVFIQKNNTELAQADVSFMFYDGSRYLVLSSFYMPGPTGNREEWRQEQYTGDIFVVDIASRKLTKKISLPREYRFISGVCKVGDKIYVTATQKGKINQDGSCPSNDELLVCQLEKGVFKKTIKISPFAIDVIFDRSVNKLYVFHRNDGQPRDIVEIIDPTKDRVIGTLEAPSQLMASVVSPGKLYLSLGGSVLNPSGTDPRLLVIDTKTDRIIKKFAGSYQGISVNSKY